MTPCYRDIIFLLKNTKRTLYMLNAWYIKKPTLKKKNNQFWRKENKSLKINVSLVLFLSFCSCKRVLRCNKRQRTLLSSNSLISFLIFILIHPIKQTLRLLSPSSPRLLHLERKQQIVFNQSWRFPRLQPGLPSIASTQTSSWAWPWWPLAT